MAIAGESTVAYLLVMKGESLSVTKTQSISSECVDPAEAAKLVKQGFRAIVKGSNMAQFHDLWRMEGEKDE